MVAFDTIFPFSKLRQGKIDEAEFSILKDGSTSGGRKTVTHEYPNSDRRFVEDFGKMKETYNLELHIDTNNGFDQRDTLKKVLNRKGTRKLTHPFYGQKTITIKGWTLFNDFGWSRFTVIFEESDPSVLPQLETGNKSLLDRLKDQIIALQETKVGETFNAIGQGFKVFNESINKVQDFSKQMLEVANSVLNSAEPMATLQNTINSTLDNTALLIKTPSELGTRITSLYTQFALIGERTKDQFDAFTGMFGFGEDDNDTKTATFNQRTIKANNEILNTAIRSNALSNAYVTSVDIDYNNNEELKEIKTILEDEYQSLISIVDDDTLDLLKNLRSQSEIVFENLQKTVPKIYTINLVSYQNIHQIVFNYYGNFVNSEDYEDKVEEIWNLNNFTNPSKIRGEVKLLT